MALTHKPTTSGGWRRRKDKQNGFLFQCRKCQAEFWINVEKIRTDPLAALRPLIDYCRECGEEQSMVIMDYGLKPDRAMEL